MYWHISILNKKEWFCLLGWTGVFWTKTPRASVQLFIKGGSAPRTQDLGLHTCRMSLSKWRSRDGCADCVLHWALWEPKSNLHSTEPWPQQGWGRKGTVLTAVPREHAVCWLVQPEEHLFIHPLILLELVPFSNLYQGGFHAQVLLVALSPG